MPTLRNFKSLCTGKVVPAPRTQEDYTYALEHTESECVILLFGDIISLPGLLAQAAKHKKKVIVHFDLLEGVGKDKAGIRLLARMGVTALITTKAHFVKTAHEEGMFVVQRLFLVDSEALRTGIHLLTNSKPDMVEILPASVPAAIIKELTSQTRVPVMAGGLLHTKEDALSALKNGVTAVSASRRELWNLSL